MRLILSILARGGQPLGPQPTRWEATTLEVPTFHIPLFLTSDLHFPLKGPARSQIIHPIITNIAKVNQTLNLMSGSLYSTCTEI
jgi:hypothetical protein